MKVFARFELSRGRLRADESALLLEGEWPGDQSHPSRRSLDREIDSRSGWIDQQAVELAEQFSGAAHDSRGPRAPGLAWLNVVKLRYLLVKLLRVVAFFDSRAGAILPNVCEFFCERGRDVCYEQVLRAVGQRHGFEVLVKHADLGNTRASAPTPTAQNWNWRRAAESWLRHAHPAVAANKPRVVLCGNPRLLAPVCHELVRRGMQPWWLTERFAPRTWLRWRPAGGGLLACDGSQNSMRDESHRAMALAPLPQRATEQVSLATLVAPAVETWLNELGGQLGTLQSRQFAQIAQHFDRLAPLHVVLDQDGSPFNRAVVAAAQQRGVVTSIVQHGAPFIRFGFAPLVADRFCAWGETSRAQLVRWGVPRERIFVTGTAMALPGNRIHRAQRSPRFVLLATLAPSDARPDAVTYHLTGHTYAAMLRSALAAVSKWPGASLTIKLHPRDPRSPTIRRIAAEFPWLKTKIVCGRSLAGVLRTADYVFSCASSAGIEAAARGWPVIQLMPQGSCELLEATAWALTGTARNQAELEALISAVLAERRKLPDGTQASIIAATDGAAAGRIVDALLLPIAEREPAEVASQVPAETLYV